MSARGARTAQDGRNGSEGYLLTLDEAAAMLRVSRRSVERLTADNLATACSDCNAGKADVLL